MPPTRFSTDSFVCRRSECGIDAAWVQVGGELDISTAPRLEQTLSDALLDASLVVLDLRQVTFMDLTGLRVILEADQLARDDGRALNVLPGSAEAARIFELTGASGQINAIDGRFASA